jgi:serine/threonine-protein kinase
MRKLFVVVAFAASVSVGCGDSSGVYAQADSSTQQACTPGQSSMCTAPEGCAGVRFCNASGAFDTASFWNPAGIAVDAAANVYVGDYVNRRVRKVTPAGVVTTLAGSGSDAFADGTGAAASFHFIESIALYTTGNLYVTDRNRIREVTPAGVVTTLAGSKATAFADGAGPDASFYFPSGIALDRIGNAYAADLGNNRIRQVTPAGVVTTLAGSARGYADGTGVAASFDAPDGVQRDTSRERVCRGPKQQPNPQAHLGRHRTARGDVEPSEHAR